MTNLELLKKLSQLNDHQLTQQASVFDTAEDECFPIIDTKNIGEYDMWDDHFVIII